MAARQRAQTTGSPSIKISLASLRSLILGKSRSRIGNLTLLKRLYNVNLVPGCQEKAIAQQACSARGQLVLVSFNDAAAHEKKAQPIDQGRQTDASLEGANRLDLLSLSQPTDKLKAGTLAFTPAVELENAESAKKSLEQTKFSQATKDNQKSGFTHAAIEVGSSLTAGIGGTVGYSLLRSAPLPPLARALSLPAAMAAGGILKYGSKTGMEYATLDKSEHTASSKDLVWGAVDAISGIGASKVERLVSTQYFTALGRRELGASVAQPVAQHTGYLLAKESLSAGFKSNTLRGLTGGAAGAAIWSTPHRVSENWQEIKEKPIDGLLKSSGQIASDTAFGSVMGGGLGFLGTGAARYKDVYGKVKAKVNPDTDVLRLDNYHINDFHSNTEALPRLTTLVRDLQNDSAKRGVDGRFFVPGDIESGRINFAFTQGGKVENEILIKAGAKELVPGNHAYDAPGGKGDVARYPAIMEPLLQKNPDVSLLAANLDVSAYPQYERILKPYSVRTVKADGVEHKVATIGLTTEEGAIEGLKYIDAAQAAEKAIRELNAQGVKIINIHSHLGLGEDIKLAQHLISKDLKVAGIFGGHSHDALPRPLWVGARGSNPESSPLSLLPFVRSSQPGNFEIPIAQAGHSGNWVGEMRQAIRPDGTAHRYQTTGRLHQVSADIAEDPATRQFLDANLTDIKALKDQSYGASAASTYEVANSRNRETALANLMADSIYEGLKKRLGDQAPQAVMVHSGGIRADLPASQNLTRLDIANIVMNAGKREGEQKELVMVTLKGSELKNAIEYGLRERTMTKPPSLADRFKAMFKEPHSELVDEPGNFVQASGLRYSFDASRAPITPTSTGDRVVNLEIRNAQGQFEAVKPDGTYTIATRFHPLEKWYKFNIFGPNRTLDDVHKQVNATALPYSQVDLIGEHISGKTIDPLKVSPVEGRITDLSKTAENELLHPGKSLFTQPIIAGRETDKKGENK